MDPPRLHSRVEMAFLLSSPAQRHCNKASQNQLQEIRAVNKKRGKECFFFCWSKHEYGGETIASIAIRLIA
jgi:hypothetical protein